MSDCYYCGNEIPGASINGKHGRCASDQIMHRRMGVIFSRQNVAEWLRERAGKLRDIGALTGEESSAMLVALNLASAADQIEKGEVARWVREREKDIEFVCPCHTCRFIRENKARAP